MGTRRRPVSEAAPSSDEASEEAISSYVPATSQEIAENMQEVAKDPGTPKEILDNAVDTHREVIGRRHPSFASRAFDRMKNLMQGKRVVPTGNNVNSKLLTSPHLPVGIREVSVGTDILIASIRQDSVLLDRVNEYAEKAGIDARFSIENFIGAMPGESTVDKDKSAYMDELVDVINKLEIPVVLTKSPVSEQTSTQKRILRAHKGSGIAIHPLAAKGFVADFDGDGATVHFGEDLLPVSLDAMECLFSIDGKNSLIDFEYALIPDISVKVFARMLEKRGVLNSFEIANAIKQKDSDAFAKAAMQIRNLRYRAYAIDTAMNLSKELYIHSVLDVRDNSNYTAPDYIDALDITPEEEELNRIIESGSMPANYQEFVTALSRFNGDIAGKNPHFRVGADLGKLIKWNEEIFEGKEGLQRLYVKTCKAINAKYMSGKLFSGEDHQSRLEWIQAKVISEAGFPEYSSFDGAFEAWYEKFKNAYNDAIAMSEQAKHQYRQDMSAIEIKIEKESLKSLNEATAGDIASAFVKIYGDFSVEKIFGFKRSFEAKPGDQDGTDVWKTGGYLKAMSAKYRAMSVSEFSKKNHCVTTSHANDGKFVNLSDSQRWERLFEAVADKRSGDAAKYNKKLEENLEEQIKVLKKLSAVSDENSYSALAERDYLIGMLESCGPDLYAYLGIENTRAFMESEWGKLMMRAQNADQLGGIRYAMVIEMRLEKIATLVRSLSSDNPNTDAVIENKVQLEYELDVLASSSDAWKAIIQDAVNGNELWSAFATSKSEIFKDRLPKSKSNSSKYDHMIDIERHPSLVHFIGDPSIGMDAKDRILSDIVRLNERYDKISGFEMAKMLEMNPASSYAGSNTLGWSDSEDDVLKSSLDKMRREPDKSYMEGMALKPEQVGTILNYLKDPWNYMTIDDEMYADAVVASMDKAYADTEKSRQQASVNALYSALSYQINGGLYSDVYRGDDKALGRIAYDQVSPFDLIRALSDPDFSVLVYDEYGNLSELSCESLCGGLSDEHKTAFLKKNPRLFSFMRGMTVTVLDGSDGKAQVCARSSIMETLREAEENRNNAQRKALYTLRDHPGWGAMCALFTPAHGKTSMQQRFSVRNTEKKLLGALSYYSKTGKLPDLSGLRKHDKFMRKYAIEAGIDISDISLIEKEVTNLFMKYRAEIGDFTGIDPIKMDVRFDAESVNMFYDTRQTLSGAKTSVSTGVEGAETKRTAASFPFFASLSEVFSKFFAVKRAKGGEEFNLKAKKAGDDGLDSITKSRKYFERGGDWKSFEIELKKAYGSNRDIQAAETLLGLWLAECNHEIGYEEMSESDYADIAHLLIKETEDGIIVRSLSQINTAIRNKLPGRMNVSSFRNAPIDDILSNSSDIADECGLGSGDILSALYGMRMPSISRRIKPALRARSSSEARNFQLLQEIDEVMRSADESDNAKWLTPDQKQANHNHWKTMMDPNILKWATGSKSYSISGLFYTGYGSWRAMPGTSNLLVVTDFSKEAFDKANDIAMRYGMTLVFPCDMHRYLDPEVKRFMIPEPDGSKQFMLLPYFEMKLNGYGEAKSGRVVYDPSNFVVSVEDSINEHGLGDAAAAIMKRFSDRITIKKTGTWRDQATDMFSVFIDKYDGSNFKFRMATSDEIRNNIIEWKVDNPPDIDFRVTRSNKNWNDMVEKTSRQIAEFGSNWDPNGFVLKGYPDSIVGWAAMDIIDNGGSKIKTVFAPITPFTNYDGNSKTVPQDFDVTDIKFDSDHGTFSVEWVHTGNLENQFYKMHEGLAAANKMIAFSKPLKDRSLKSGLGIDVMYPAASTSSRRLGWNARLQTLYSMFAMARLAPYGYNFAESGDSLPNPEDENLKNRMKSGEIPLSEWIDMSVADSTGKSEIDRKRWHRDDRINAFVKNQIKMCLGRGIHPDDFLASRYTREDGTVVNTNIYYEYDMLFKPSFRYQDDLMRYLHSMMPTLCAESLEDESEDYLFKPCKDKGWKYGSMQCQVPRLDENGNVKTHTWENVYASFGFFSDDYSGFHSPSVGAANIMTQELAVAVQNGNVGKNGRLLGMFMDWAFSGTAAAPKPTSFIADDVSFFGLGAESSQQIEESDKAVNEKDRNDEEEWDPEIAVAFTGHRPKQGLYEYEDRESWISLYHAVMQAIEDQYDKGKRVFIHGGAQGLDQIAAMAVHKFRESHPDVKSVMAIPISTQDSQWSNTGMFSKKMYSDIKNDADIVKVLSDGPYNRKVMMDRNTWMLDHASSVIAAYDTQKKYGGTFDTITKARNRNMPVTNVLQESSQQIEDEKTEFESSDVIDSFRGEFYFLSNMYDSPFVWNRIEWQNAEQAFQAAKLLFFGDEKNDDILEEMSSFSRMSAKEAKIAGRRIDLTEDMLREWDRIKTHIMREIVFNKFAYNDELKSKLIDTGNRKLIEGNTWGDDFWGVSNGSGRNELGKILMEARDFFKE